MIAKSYEMKARGVKTGTPIWDARVACPEGVYVKRDFHWYEVLSSKMLEVVGTFSPRVEYYSIDEFFFEALPGNCKCSLQATATAIRDHIREYARLPVTIGIARTRTLAKLFLDTGKPFGAVAVLDRDHERALLSQLPVTEISGIAGQRAARLAPYGIRTCLDLANADGKLVNKLLTKTGYEIWLELNGTRVTPIRPERPPHQTLARGGSLMGNVEDPVVLWAWAVRHTERLIEELDYHNGDSLGDSRWGIGSRVAADGQGVGAVDSGTVRRGGRQVLLQAVRDEQEEGRRAETGRTGTQRHARANQPAGIITRRAARLSQRTGSRTRPDENDGAMRLHEEASV